jgi:hypothetical protein
LTASSVLRKPAPQEVHEDCSDRRIVDPVFHRKNVHILVIGPEIVEIRSRNQLVGQVADDAGVGFVVAGDDAGRNANGPEFGFAGAEEMPRRAL